MSSFAGFCFSFGQLRFNKIFALKVRDPTNTHVAKCWFSFSPSFWLFDLMEFLGLGSILLNNLFVCNLVSRIHEPVVQFLFSIAMIYCLSLLKIEGIWQPQRWINCNMCQILHHKWTELNLIYHCALLKYAVIRMQINILHRLKLCCIVL